MKRTHLKATALLMSLCVGLLAIAPQPVSAASYKLNLKDKQTFYILPGNTDVDYKIKLTSGTQIGQSMTCVSSDDSKATVSNDGALNIHDAGSCKLTITYNGETVTRTIQSLIRSDWTRVVSIANSQKITVSKDRVATYKIKNLMDFPLKVKINYHTYDQNGKLLQTDIFHSPIYIAANESLTYKELMPEGVKYLSVSSVTFDYDQYGLDTISPKKVAIKEKISKSKKSKTTMIIKETITNQNKNTVLVPYQTFVYDKNGKITSISYNTFKVLAKQKNVFNGKYYTRQPAGQSEYASKVVFKFSTPMPEF